MTLRASVNHISAVKYSVWACVEGTCDTPFPYGGWASTELLILDRLRLALPRAPFSTTSPYLYTYYTTIHSPNGYANVVRVCKGVDRSIACVVCGQWRVWWQYSCREERPRLWVGLRERCWLRQYVGSFSLASHYWQASVPQFAINTHSSCDIPFRSRTPGLIGLDVVPAREMYYYPAK